MENNKTVRWIWAIAIIVIIVGLILIAKKNPTSDSAVTTDTEVSTSTSATTAVAKTPVKTTTTVKKTSTNVVEYTATGFKPFVLEIKRGESVEFVNMSDKAMTIKSLDDKPGVNYPGFSQESGPLGKGGKFYFAFTMPGAWPYQNLNNKNDQGVIIVK